MPFKINIDLYCEDKKAFDYFMKEARCNFYEFLKNDEAPKHIYNVDNSGSIEVQIEEVQE